MVLFIICCVILGIITLGALCFMIYAFIEDGVEGVLWALLILIFAGVAAIAPIIGVVDGIYANAPVYVEATYQSYKAEYDTLSAAVANNNLTDIGITDRIVQYNVTVAYNKTMRQSKWKGYFYNAAFERLELIEY